MGLWGPAGGGMGGVGFGMSPDQMETLAAANLAAATTEEGKRKAEDYAAAVSTSVQGGFDPGIVGSTTAERAASRMERTRTRATGIKKAMDRRKGVQVAVDDATTPKYYGRPHGRWVAHNMMVDYIKGQASAAQIKGAVTAGAGPDLAAVAMRMGRDVLSTVPGFSEVISALDLADKIPLVGDLTGVMQDILGGFLGEGLGFVGDITGGVLDVVESVPVVGDIAGMATGALRSIPLLGSLF